MSDVAPAGRWRPARAGIRNIWEYDDQIFDFADGRLVLRGPNGSGKSNALALLVPFLLDGVMAAYRMDSLSGGRSMKTLLLCLAEDERSNRFRHEQRTGYVWLEFQRGPENMTIGCGARASAQRDAEAWFFVTPRRPGIDLDLAPGGVPLSKGGLTDTLGAPAVHDSADSYRAAVDRALFGLGAHRYRNLVELLLVLRRPHLAGKLNLEQLSHVLSDGLAALDEQLIADVAASFDDLEAVQQDLRRLQEAHRTVEAFLPVYRRYLRAIARSRATDAVETARALRAARRRVSEAEREMTAAAAETERLRQARLACDEDREVAEERQRAVLVSSAYRDAKSLGEIEERLADDAVQLDRAEHRLAEAKIHRDGAVADRDQVDHTLKQVSAEADRAFATVAEAADLAGVPWTLGRDEVSSPDLARLVRDLGARRRQDISEVRGALSQAEHAAAQAEATRTAAARASEDAQKADDRRQEAAADLDRARSALADALRQWAVASQIPELGGAMEVAVSLGDPGAPSLADFVTEALRPRRDNLAARQARAQDLAAALSGDRAELVAERQRVADDPVPSPARWPTRPADRSARAGAPLYACCDFVETVPEADRAGLEAALEAAGLLDAWVGPAHGDADGGGGPRRHGEGPGELDAWLRAGPPVTPPSLADVLVPTPPDGSGLEAGTVRDLLMSISLADAGPWSGRTGLSYSAPLSGRFAKPVPDFIGTTAREQRRRRLLAELDERIADLSARLAQAADELSGVAAEQRRLDAVMASAPPVAAALRARDVLMQAVTRASTSREIAARAGSVAHQAVGLAEEKTSGLRALAASRRLPTSGDGLQHADGLVHSYQQHAGDLVSAVRSLAERRADQAAVAQRVARTDQQLAGRQAERDDLHRHVRGLQARVEQLRSQLGADADAPIRDLAGIQEELRRLRDVAEDLARQAEEAAEQRGRADQETRAARAEVGDRETSAAASAARLDVLRRQDIWSVVAGEAAVPGAPGEPGAVASGPAGPQAPGELGAVVLAATADVTVEADANALQRAYRQLMDELGRYDPSLSWVDDVGVVEVTSDAGTFSVVWLAQELADHVLRQQALLSDRDPRDFRTPSAHPSVRGAARIVERRLRPGGEVEQGARQQAHGQR